MSGPVVTQFDYADLVSRLDHCSHHTSDEYLHELTGKARDMLVALAATEAAASAREAELVAGLERATGALDCIAEPIDFASCVGDPWDFYRDLQAIARDAHEKASATLARHKQGGKA